MVKNYDEAYDYLKQLPDKNLRILMRSAFSTIITDGELDSFESSDEFDMLAIVKFLEIFLSEKHLLQAYLSSDWSGILWWGDEDF